MAPTMIVVFTHTGDGFNVTPKVRFRRFWSPVLVFFFSYKIQTLVTRGSNLEYAGGGAACTQPTCSLGVVVQAVHQKKQKIHRYREG